MDKIYRVTIASFQYRTIDIRASSANKAEQIVQSEIEKDEEYVNNHCPSPYEYGSYVVENEAFEVDENGDDVELKQIIKEMMK